MLFLALYFLAVWGCCVYWMLPFLIYMFNLFVTKYLLLEDDLSAVVGHCIALPLLSVDVNGDALALE
jgi:hypothetical protein